MADAPLTIPKLRSPDCWCGACDSAANQGWRSRMSLCPACGDKRCPRAENHENPCTTPSPPVAAPAEWVPDMAHVANEWADMAANGLVWLRNVRDGISTAEEAIANMEGNLQHCYDTSAKAKASQPQPPRPGTAPLSNARLLIGKIVNKHGDPEAFAERELQIDGDIQKLPIGTRVYVDRAARVLTRAGHQTMHEAMLDGAEIVSRGHPTAPTPKD